MSFDYLEARRVGENWASQEHWKVENELAEERGFKLVTYEFDERFVDQNDNFRYRSLDIYDYYTKKLISSYTEDEYDQAIIDYKENKWRAADYYCDDQIEATW